METKINIAEILRNKPHGVKLYSPIFGDCTYCYVREDTNDICVKKHNGVIEYFNYEGLYFALGEVMLFPSKEMRVWDKFAWKKGDALSCGVDNLCIFEKWANEEYTEFYAKFVTPNYSGNTFKTEKWSKETNEAVIKQYISNIEEFKGGKLNLTTLEIEKTQPEFKDGDIVAVDLDRKNIRIFKEKKNINNFCWGKYYIGFSFNNEGRRIQTFKNYTADCCSDRFATDSEKQQLLLALENEGKAWDAEKKQIVDLKPKWTPKPFDKVLVRANGYNKWQVSLFGYKDGNCYYCCCGFGWSQCIPYIGNESLLGTTKDMED